MNFSHFAEEVLLDSLKDFGRLLPFLFLTYLFMELRAHKAGEGMQRTIRRAGRLGPLFGGLLGVLPQCGFSAAASGLYAGRVITLGTLISVYLSTSDEMLPILISEQQPLDVIAGFVLIKVAMCQAEVDLLKTTLSDRENNYINSLVDNQVNPTNDLMGLISPFIYGGVIAVVAVIIYIVTIVFRYFL